MVLEPSSVQFQSAHLQGYGIQEAAMGKGVPSGPGGSTKYLGSLWSKELEPNEINSFLARVETQKVGDAFLGFSFPTHAPQNQPLSPEPCLHLTSVCPLATPALPALVHRHLLSPFVFLPSILPLPFILTLK